MPDWAAIIDKVPDAALVVLFMWYTRERDKAWQKFLADAQEAYGKNAGRLADEIKGISREVSALGAVLLAHDTYTRSVVPTLQAGRAAGQGNSAAGQGNGAD